MNSIKDKLTAGKAVYGSFFELGSGAAMEAMGIAGLDFAIIDCEHGPFNPQVTMEWVRAAEVRNIVPFARIQEISRASVLKMLDIGVKGLIVPCVHSVEEVKDLIKWAKYAPMGERGFFTARPAGYGHDLGDASISQYMESTNKGNMLIPQCETLGALNVIEEIMGLKGVDGIFVGPFDLSIAMGIPGDFHNPKFQQALDRIVKAAKNENKPAFIYAPNTLAAKEQMERGYQGIAISMDVGILIDGYKSLLAQLK
ncbi:MAG: host specificity protein [Tissierellia bacterium]|nr:host specificity protein [Tissierellia bacterium]